MLKVKMLVRHHGQIGKMEYGFIYFLPADYARELIGAGLAELVMDKPVFEKPIHVTAKEIGKVRTKSGRFAPRTKVK